MSFRRLCLVGLLLLLLLLLLAGCPYHTGGSLPPEYRTICVELLLDRSRYPGLGYELTSALSRELQSYGRLQVVSPGRASDLTLRGEVFTYRKEVLRADALDDPVELRVEIRARVWLVDKSGREILKEAEVSNQATIPDASAYNLSRGALELSARRDAVNRLARAIARAVLDGGW